MEFIAVSIGVQKFSNQHFRLCVLAFDLAHVIAAGFFGMNVCHRAKVVIAFASCIQLCVFAFDAHSQ